jgi:YVTN family beta-propeller protein
VTPDGGRLFLVHQLISEISVIDTATNQVIRTIPIFGRENDVLFTLDGRFAYFANFNGGTVDVVDTDTYELTSIPTGPGSRRLAISPTGDRVAVSNFLDDSVSVIDTLTQTVIATVPVGIAPRGIAITPSGDAIYTTNVRDGTASIIDSRTLKVKTLTVELKPWQVVITDDGTTAFITNAGSNTVSVIDTASRKIIKTIVVGVGPFFLAIHPDGEKLYVSNAKDTTVTVIDIPSLNVLRTIRNIGMQPFDLDFGP